MATTCTTVSPRLAQIGPKNYTMRQSKTIPRVCGTLSKRVDEKILSRNGILLMFYHREATRAAHIRALVRTKISQRICREHISPQTDSKGLQFYELESNENQWILCDSTMDFDQKVQLLATLAPSSRRV